MLESMIINNSVHIGRHFNVNFQRTLRIPDDGIEYPLPPGLGSFPVFSTATYADQVPRSWLKNDSVFIPTEKLRLRTLGRLCTMCEVEPRHYLARRENRRRDQGDRCSRANLLTPHAVFARILAAPLRSTDTIIAQTVCSGYNK